MPRNRQARHRSQSQQAKTISGAGCSATSNGFTVDLCPRKDAIRRQKSGESWPGIGLPIAFPKHPEVTEVEASDLEGFCWMAKKRTAECIVVIWTQRVPYSQCPSSSVRSGYLRSKIQTCVVVFLWCSYSRSEGKEEELECNPKTSQNNTTRPRIRPQRPIDSVCFSQ